MDKTAKYAWKGLKECFDAKIKPNYKEIEFDETKKEQFVKRFNDYYKKIKIDYMTKETKILDRHKQAAILICCVLEENIINSKDIPKGKIFVGKYSLALSLGLAFLCDRLNERLEENKIFEKITDLTDIEPFACPTTYFDVLFRNLYFEEREMNKVFVLTLANTLFLLEYIALIKKNIPLEKLREYNNDNSEQ